MIEHRCAQPLRIENAANGHAEATMPGDDGINTIMGDHISFAGFFSGTNSSSPSGAVMQAWNAG